MVRKNISKEFRYNKKKPIVNNDDLIEAEGRRVPVCFCIDTSLSMNIIVDEKDTKATGQRISFDGIKGELVEGGVSIKDCVNERLSKFYKILARDSKRLGIEIALVTFDDYTMVHDFKSIKALGNIPVIHTKGEKSYLGEGLETALEVLELRKEGYKKQELSYYQPFLIVMTDGLNTKDDEIFEEIKNKIVEKVKQKKLNLIICSFSDNIPPALKELQKGNDELMASYNKGYGNPLFTMDSTIKIEQLFNYITKTVGGLS